MSVLGHETFKKSLDIIGKNLISVPGVASNKTLRIDCSSSKKGVGGSLYHNLLVQHPIILIKVFLCNIFSI